MHLIQHLKEEMMLKGLQPSTSVKESSDVTGKERMARVGGLPMADCECVLTGFWSWQLMSLGQALKSGDEEELNVGFPLLAKLHCSIAG